MPDSSWEDELTPVLRQLQIIVGSLGAGCGMFALFVVFLRGGNARAGQPLTVTYIAIGVACICVIARMIVPARIVAAARRKIVRGIWQRPSGANPTWLSDEVLERAGDAARLWPALQTSTILAAALIEAGTLILLAVHIVDHSYVSLVPGLLLMHGLFLHVPRRSRLVRWTQGQLKLLEEERQLGM